MWPFPNFLSTESLFHGLSLIINVLRNTLRSADEAYWWQLVCRGKQTPDRSCPVAETGPAAGSVQSAATWPRSVPSTKGS